MIEFLGDRAECFLDRAELAEHAGHSVRFAAQSDLRIERMAMDAAVLRRTGIQPMGGIERKFLRNFNHCGALAVPDTTVKDAALAGERFARGDAE